MNRDQGVATHDVTMLARCSLGQGFVITCDLSIVPTRNNEFPWKHIVTQTTNSPSAAAIEPKSWQSWENHVLQNNFCYQCSVAEWLRWWANLGVMWPPLSYWEVVDLNPSAGMSRIGFKLFHPGKKFQWFSLPENVSYLFSAQQDHLVANF